MGTGAEKKIKKHVFNVWNCQSLKSYNIGMDHDESERASGDEVVSNSNKLLRLVEATTTRVDGQERITRLAAKR